jgi:hypothetical protein
MVKSIELITLSHTINIINSPTSAPNLSMFEILAPWIENTRSTARELIQRRRSARNKSPRIAVSQLARHVFVSYQPLSHSYTYSTPLDVYFLSPICFRIFSIDNRRPIFPSVY